MKAKKLWLKLNPNEKENSDQSFYPNVKHRCTLNAVSKFHSNFLETK